MTTYNTITEAFDSVLGRSRSRNEVESGVTTKIVDGVKVREAEYCKYYNKEGNLNVFNEDFTEWKRTLVKDKKSAKDEALLNSYFMGETFEVLIGGDFETEEVQMKKVRTKIGTNSYRVKEVPKKVKVSHSVRHLGKFRVISVNEDEKEITFFCKKV